MVAAAISSAADAIGRAGAGNRTRLLALAPQPGNPAADASTGVERRA
jgi:hypothetical protein